MYLSAAEVIAIVIVLGINLVLLFVLGYANATLIKENRYLRARARRYREACRNHVEVPF